MAQFQSEPILFDVPSGKIKCSVLGKRLPSSRLSVVVPGAAYSSKQPLLYYLTQALLSQGDQVLTIDSLYADDENWLSLPTEEARYRYVLDDAESLFPQIQALSQSGIHTVVARSLGAYSLACALRKDLIHPEKIVWQCPSLHDKWSILKNSKSSSIVIIGKADSRYDHAAPFLPAGSFVAENADHTMEVGDPIQSIDILKRVTEYTVLWLEDTCVDVSQLERNIRLTPEQRLTEHQAALDLCEKLAQAGQRFNEQSQ
ncbi:MAG: hypothetical protein HC902_00070 [Calothrix sp. SM1_5_4]|nr:hypothetical protein [Calothrix sp. SM1_5_4]